MFFQTGSTPSRDRKGLHASLGVRAGVRECVCVFLTTLASSMSGLSCATPDLPQKREKSQAPASEENFVVVSLSPAFVCNFRLLGTPYALVQTAVSLDAGICSPDC